MIGVQIGDIIRRHPAFAEDLHIGQFGQHGHAPVAHPAPCGKAGQGAFMCDAPAEAAAGLGLQLQPVFVADQDNRTFLK